MTDPAAGAFPPLDLALPAFQAAPAYRLLLEYPPLKALLPVVVLCAIAPAIYWLFKDTWRELDEEARAYARTTEERDLRPALCLLLVAVTLTLHHYYGGRSFYHDSLRPLLHKLEQAGHPWLQVDKFGELYGYGWWVGARVLGYMIVPICVWKLAFPRDSILDMGLRLRGFFDHIWLYVLSLGAVLLAMTIVAQQPDFLSYYPFYKTSSRSWLDLLAWEAIYFVQFFALEFYFRGFMLSALRRTTGSAAIFIMALPYCMIHYGKPYLEAHGAIVAGVVLGSLAMKARSVYAGFFVHISVAGLMDYLALSSRDALPTSFWP